MGLGVTGLGVLRALARSGHRVFATGDPGDPARRSRDATFVGALPAGAGRTEALRACVTAIGGRPVLLPVSDGDVVQLAHHAGELRPGARFLSAEARIVEALTSKVELVRLAEDAGLPLPRTVAVVGSDDIPRACRHLSMPCVVKPAHSGEWDPALATLGLRPRKAITVATHGELASLLERLVAAGAPVVAQELVPGPDESHYSYVAIAVDGHLHAEFAARKVRLQPPHLGVGTLVVSTDEPDVVALGRRAVHRARLTGAISVQVKRSADDDRLRLIEINGRFNMWNSLAEACGVGLAAAYVRAADGEEPPVRPAGWSVGRKWVNLLGDVRAMRIYLAEGAWTRDRWLASLAPPFTEALWSRHDPAPAAVAFAREGRRRLRRGVAGSPAGGRARSLCGWLTRSR